MKRKFKHASAVRAESESVLVSCELGDGKSVMPSAMGFGEGVPRNYVTGETPAGCLAQLEATPLAEQLSADCNSWPDVINLCNSFAPTVDRDNPRGCYGNALRCAVELSILNAFGQLFGEPVSAVAKHYAPAQAILASPPNESAKYSAVIDAGNTSLPRKALLRRLYGFSHCKVKVGAAGDDDAARLKIIRRWIGKRMDLRVDANEAWHAEELLQRFSPLRPFNISCIEQPLPHAEVAALTELRSQLGVPVMLDESLTSEIDAHAAIAGKTCDMFNIRLSKCGGFLASLRLAAIAHSAGLGYQLGCHPGETGFLSAAGRHWACAVRGIRYCEGSYDRFLFGRKSLTRPDMTFGYGGRAPKLPGPGLGVFTNPDVFRQAVVATDIPFERF